jgi:hypothetical protein
MTFQTAISTKISPDLLVGTSNKKRKEVILEVNVNSKFESFDELDFERCCTNLFAESSVRLSILVVPTSIARSKRFRGDFPR